MPSQPGERVLLLDDVLATGGTAAATRRLVEMLGGDVVGFGCVLELGFLSGRQKPARAGRGGARQLRVRQLRVEQVGQEKGPQLLPRGTGERHSVSTVERVSRGRAAATVERVLPWRRPGPARDGNARPLAGGLPRTPSQGRRQPDFEGVRDGGARPQGQVRRSGEPFISHPLAVATVLAGLGMDDITLAAALLHDSVEDTAFPWRTSRPSSVPSWPRSSTGSPSSSGFRSTHGRRPRRPRCAKCSSPWPRTPESCSLNSATGCTTCAHWRPCQRPARNAPPRRPWTSMRPLAHRFGIADMKWQLEDLAFATLHPRRYAQIEQMVAARAPERDIYLAQVIEQVEERLVAARIDAQVNGRPKHLYSIYEKMVLKNKEFDEIYDLVGRAGHRRSVKDCWAALGAVHGTWAPVQGRFKDYINTPEVQPLPVPPHHRRGAPGQAPGSPNPDLEMHSRAERGIAAHWGYKENASAADVAWLQRIVDWSAESTDPAEFLEGLKLDLESDEVFVFTPKGDVVALPIGATPGRLRLLHPHRGRATAASGPGSTAGWSRSTPS